MIFLILSVRNVTTKLCLQEQIRSNRSQSREKKLWMIAMPMFLILKKYIWDLVPLEVMKLNGRNPFFSFSPFLIYRKKCPHWQEISSARIWNSQALLFSHFSMPVCQDSLGKQFVQIAIHVHFPANPGITSVVVNRKNEKSIFLHFTIMVRKNVSSCQNLGTWKCLTGSRWIKWSTFL